MTATSPAAAAWRGRIARGDARFELPDPEGASGGSWARDEGHLCVFAGHLYNARRLVREIPGPTSSLASAPEIVLAGYKLWGEDVLRRLDGVFALAIWDKSNQSLLCGRDPVGLHPFFYSLAGGGIVFSWDLEAVAQHPDVSRALSPVAVAEHLIHHWWNAHETLFASIRRLPGGHGLRFLEGRVEIFRYWNPLPQAGPAQWVTEDELAEFPALFRQAVEDVMEAGHGRTGILLSGGLDSVSVAAEAVSVAAGRGWDPPIALSVAFPEAASEEPIQRGVAEKLGLPQTFARLEDYLNGPGLLHSAIEMARHYSSPPEFTAAPAFLDLLKIARQQGCEAVLTGDGGDETLGVTPAYAADLVRRGRFLDLARMIRTVAKYWDGTVRVSFRNLAWTWGLRTVLRDWMWRCAPGIALRRRRQLLPRAIPPWVAPDPAVRKELISRYEQDWERHTSEGSFYVAYLSKYSCHPLRHMTFEEQFSRSRLASVSTLHPYWHNRLADFLLRIPPEILGRGGRWKSLIRSRVAETFPEMGFERQKKVVANHFPKQIFQREGPELWRRLGGARRLTELGVVDERLYETELERCANSDRILDLYRLWHGASTEAWSRL